MAQQVKQSKKVQIAERQAQVARLQRAGMTVRQVAEQLGVGVATVQADRMALIERNRNVADEDIAAWKAAKIESYRRKMEHIDRVLDELEADKLAPLFGAWVKVDERESKLLGTDAPARSEVLTGGIDFPTPDDARAALAKLPPPPPQ